MVGAKGQALVPQVKEVTVEPTVHAESISAISVTAVSLVKFAVQEQMFASSEQTSSSQDKTSEGLSEKPVVNET